MENPSNTIGKNHRVNYRSKSTIEIMSIQISKSLTQDPSNNYKRVTRIQGLHYNFQTLSK